MALRSYRMPLKQLAMNRAPRTHQTNRRHKSSVTMPYVQGVSEALRRVLNKHQVEVHFKPTNTVRQLLVAPKDKTDKQSKCGAIYHIACTGCSSHYIGETERPLKARMAEHRRPSCVNSPVVQHRLTTKHEIDTTSAKILDSEPRWAQRGIKEAIYIRAHNPDLNCDQGRYHLSALWDPVIRTGVRTQSTNTSSPPTS